MAPTRATSADASFEGGVTSEDGSADGAGLGHEVGKSPHWYDMFYISISEMFEH